VLIESGSVTAVNSVTNTEPIPHFENSLAMHTALAGEQLGLKLIYLEAGSGAKNPVSNRMISQVKKNISVPLIVGGGLKTKSEILEKCDAGADLIVVGNKLEENPGLLSEFSEAVHSYQRK
jgi:putative glycerol-1-phosphate prenyltransferase